MTTELARDAVALGGTVGAEHGLGKRKAHLLEIQYLPAEIEAMRAVKRRFDPSGSWGREPCCSSHKIGQLDPGELAIMLIPYEYRV